MKATSRSEPKPVPAGLARRVAQNRLTRRDVLWLFGASAAAATSAALSGCAISPVTGQGILVGMTEEEERAIDRRFAPHQFSRDLGAVQDADLNRYVAEVGGALHKVSHRPAMPYSYRVLNANYVNAYTFPGGAMALTRGIVTELEDEAQLAALLGHEIAHVNARHSAQRRGQALLAEAALVGLAVAVSDSRWGALATVAGQIGASAMLASYSRDNEREADALGQQYMVRGGYPADGMTRLQALLVREEKAKPSLLATMFASHPMSRERMETAQHLAQTQYAASLGADARRERFMDRTARLRALKPAVDACKRGEMAMVAKKLPEAESQFALALQHAPQDYAAHVLMARCLAAQGKRTDALRYAQAARQIYPHEAQAHKLAGSLHLEARDPAAALQAFEDFDRLLPGDPGIAFLKGVSLDTMGDRARAAAHYRAFLQSGAKGDAAKFAANRLQVMQGR